MKRLTEESKSYEALITLYNEHIKMGGLLTSAMWAAEVALRVPETSSF